MRLQQRLYTIDEREDEGCHLNVVLMARLDLYGSISEERKFTRVADVHLQYLGGYLDMCQRNMDEDDQT